MREHLCGTLCVTQKNDAQASQVSYKHCNFANDCGNYEKAVDANLNYGKEGASVEYDVDAVTQKKFDIFANGLTSKGQNFFDIHNEQNQCAGGDDCQNQYQLFESA